MSVLLMCSYPVGSLCVLAPEGEVDLDTAPDLREAILHRLPHGPVVVDLSAIRFMDSAGMHALVSSHRRAILLGGRLCLAAPSASVLRVLALTQVLELLEIHPSVEDAVTAARAAIEFRSVRGPERPAAAWQRRHEDRAAAPRRRRAQAAPVSASAASR